MIQQQNLETLSMLRAIGYLLLLGIVGVIFFLVAHFYKDWRTGEVYAKAIRGQSEASILEALGPPDSVGSCSHHLSWDGDTFSPPPNNGLCVKWTRYDYFLSAWAFGYSADGKLVSRYHYVSE